jgi:hypothetical protein
MEIVLVQLNSHKAYQLLRDLEELHIIKLIKKNTQPSQRLSDQYQGVFSEEDAKSFNEHIQASRKEWDNT